MTRDELLALSPGDRVALHGGEFAGYVVGQPSGKEPRPSVRVLWDDDCVGYFYYDEDPADPDYYGSLSLLVEDTP